MSFIFGVCIFTNRIATNLRKLRGARKNNQIMHVLGGGVYIVSYRVKIITGSKSEAFKTHLNNVKR